MPSNIIFFSQPLFPEGIKLLVEASYTSNQHYVPDSYTEYSCYRSRQIDWQPGDHIIVASESVWTRYRVI